MKVTIARLRSNVKYVRPLETVLDSFFENYVRFMKDNPQHQYDTYNVSFKNVRPQRTPETIKWAGHNYHTLGLRVQISWRTTDESKRPCKVRVTHR